MQKINKHGFTLIELIIVIAIIALLAAATFVAVDPAKRIGDANNAQRWSDVTAIADAYQKYVVDNSGTVPTTTTSSQTYQILVNNGTGASGSETCTNTTTEGAVDFGALVDSGYIGSIPFNPSTSTGPRTLYYFTKYGTGAIEVGACETYNSATIKVVR